MDDSPSQKRKRDKNEERNRNPRDESDEFLRRTYDSIIPNEQHRKRSKKLILKVRKAITSKFKSAEVYVYGSYASETALWRSDIDYGLKIETRNAERTMKQVSDVLEDAGINITGLRCNELRVNKKIEEVYFAWGRDGESQIKVDCSLNNSLASFSSSFVKAVADYAISTRVFLVLIKKFAQCQGLNNGEDGTLSSTGHSYLGILYLLRNNFCPQFLKQDDISEVDDLVNETKTYKSVSEQFPRPSIVTPVDTLLLGYFSYYSKHHNFKTMAISLRGGCLVRKESLGWPAEEKGYFLGIVDPFSGDNVGRAVSDTGLLKIKVAFKTACRHAEKGEFKKLFRPFKK